MFFSVGLTAHAFFALFVLFFLSSHILFPLSAIYRKIIIDNSFLRCKWLYCMLLTGIIRAIRMMEQSYKPIILFISFSSFQSFPSNNKRELQKCNPRLLFSILSGKMKGRKNLIYLLIALYYTLYIINLLIFVG